MDRAGRKGTPVREKPFSRTAEVAPARGRRRRRQIPGEVALEVERHVVARRVEAPEEAADLEEGPGPEPGRTEGALPALAREDVERVAVRVGREHGGGLVLDEPPDAGVGQLPPERAGGGEDVEHVSDGREADDQEAGACRP
jgi:hypothetical protein